MSKRQTELKWPTTACEFHLPDFQHEFFQTFDSMTLLRFTFSFFLCVFVTTILGFFNGQTSDAQTLSEMPGYDQFRAASQKRFRLVQGGRVQKIGWAKDFSKVSFSVRGTQKTLDLSTMKYVEAGEFEKHVPAGVRPATRRSPVPRAEQRKVEPSNDGEWTAIYDEFNILLRHKRTGEKPKELRITSKGNVKLRYGTCCWVYGEELDQDSAMWWSPKDDFLAYYEVSESHMQDYHLTLDNTKSYTTLQTVRYPKAGFPNPKVGILIYDMASKQTVRAEIEGEPTQYLYNVRWTPAGDELLVNRTNRHQNVLDVFAVNPKTGKSRIVLTEKQETWQNNSPEMRFLKDGKRFVWETEKNGWKNFELRDLSGKLLNRLTQADGYPVHRILKIDETSGWMYYTAYSDDNPYNKQLHRVQLDGSQDRRITTEPLHYGFFALSPDDKWVIAGGENINTPAMAILYSAESDQKLVLDRGEVSDENKKYVTSELFSFLADDGKTRIYGTLHKPSNFDPKKKYPLLIDVYGGPGSRGISNRFNPVNPYCEFGFCIAKIGNRGTIERGKAFESANYLKLGGADIQDQADGVKFLSKRSYIDGERVGIYGHSYGGYMSALAVLKFPELFHVAVSGAPVTKWENYDTIYTERYMRTPAENAKGYKLGSCMEYAGNLKGKLLLVHGLIDDNVHPANTWQLVEALHAAGKRFDMQIYPQFKHGIGSTYGQIRWEYLIKNLNPQP